MTLTVDADGGLFISGNTAQLSNTYMTPTTPAETVRVKGAVLDTLPDTPASLPGSTLSGGVYQLAAPLLITGLGSNIAVPVRLSQGGIRTRTQLRKAVYGHVAASEVIAAML